MSPDAYMPKARLHARLKDVTGFDYQVVTWLGGDLEFDYVMGRTAADLKEVENRARPFLGKTEERVHVEFRTWGNFVPDYTAR